MIPVRTITRTKHELQVCKKMTRLCHIVEKSELFLTKIRDLFQVREIHAAY